MIKASGGRLKLNFAVPMVVLKSVGARSGERREVPLVLAVDRLARVFALHYTRSGDARTISVLRLTPAGDST